ncbi:MAG: serine/threonine protein kinase, partial [Planctomycetes bacterium]|nr:serine/threonine protein kinase [Planctomycetota bacterium]
MTSIHHQRAKEVFLRACALETSARARFLDEACGDDRALRAEVESLLGIDENIDVAGARSPVSSSFWISSAGEAETPLPDRLGHYRIGKKLGQGGMGVVHVGEDLKLKRRVALKFLPPTIARSPAMLDRFEREAQLLAALNHPNIATIHSLEEFDGHRFLALELIPGETLAERLRQRRLGIPETVAIARQIAIALEAAHAEGIVHRDLKPANIFLCPTHDDRIQAKVLDFGVAKQIRG